MDAIAWVLGAQAPGSVRSQKMEDVIFAGTAKRPALGRAEVSLTIDNTAKIIPLDFNEITISRTLFRDGDSEYAMNNALIRADQIQHMEVTDGDMKKENKIKPAGQPKLDLKTYGEDKELEYVLSVTELPKVEIKSLENIKFDEYTVKIDDSEADKRIKEIAKNQPNFKEGTADTKAKEGDLVALDYKATIEGKEFKGICSKNCYCTW